MTAFFATQAKTLNEGLDGELEGILKEYKDAGLIIIDTLQKVREVPVGTHERIVQRAK